MSLVFLSFPPLILVIIWCHPFQNKISVRSLADIFGSDFWGWSWQTCKLKGVQTHQQFLSTFYYGRQPDHRPSCRQTCIVWRGWVLCRRSGGFWFEWCLWRPNIQLNAFWIYFILTFRLKSFYYKMVINILPCYHIFLFSPLHLTIENFMFYG